MSNNTPNISHMIRCMHCGFAQMRRDPEECKIAFDQAHRCTFVKHKKEQTLVNVAAKLRAFF